MDNQAHMELLDKFFKSLNRSTSAKNGFSALVDFGMDQSDDFWIWCLTTGRSQYPRLNDFLPAPVETSIQERYTGLSGESAFKQAVGFKKICQDQLNARNTSILPRHEILDFGCGWGRISLSFLNRVRPEYLHAVDVGDDAIELCRQSGIPIDIRKIEPAPPLPFPDRQFDIILSYSVFSHLSEDYFLRWTREFHRILKPGGFAFLTTRPRDAIQWFKDLRESSNIPDYARGPARSFVDAAAAFNDYDAGRFCFSPEETPHIGDYFGEACIPSSYVEKRLKGLFEVVDMVLFEEHYLFDQNLIVLRK